MAPPVAAVMTFTTGLAGGVCGEARTGGAAGAILQNLNCGGLNIGGGDSTIPEGPTPDNAASKFNASCIATTCTITERTAAETGSSDDCTDIGCSFGTRLPIVNGGLSTCVTNTFGSPGSGSLDLTTGAFSGSVPLDSQVNVTGIAASPCPTCVAGVCAGLAAATPGSACTSINASNNTYDCVANGVPLLPFLVNLTPLTTGTSAVDTAGTGLFCPGQIAGPSGPGRAGCFGHPGVGNPLAPGTVCDYIEGRGSDAVGISIGGGTVSTTFASVFCIPATGNGLIDGAADLPGPGMTSLPGTLEIL